MLEDGSTEVEMVREGVSLVSVFQETEEVEIFDSTCIQEVIGYKWDVYGRRFHLLGFTMHCFYVVVMNIYVAEVYMKED